MKYTYNTFKELFDSHIQYAYEGQYGCYTHSDPMRGNGATFHKLSIYENGKIEYKGHWEEYDPRLWPKVKLLVEMLQETPAEKVLFKAKP
jgi:hypothetical protein